MGEIKYAIYEANRKKCTILPDGSAVPFNSEHTINDHVNVIGASGSGKTRSIVIPNILAETGSMVIADMKGNLYRELGRTLRNDGYKVLHLDFIHPERSMRYNPLLCVRTSNDVQKLAHQIVFLSPGGISERDPFWDRSAELLLSALIGYISEGGSGISANICGILKLLSCFNAEAMEKGAACTADKLFEEHNCKSKALSGSDSWAYQQYIKFRGLAGKTMSCVMATVYSLMGPVDTKEIRDLTSKSDFDIISFGKEKTALFIEVSDTDRSKDMLINLFYTQSMNRLCEYADSRPKSRLDVPVRYILDDFGTSCRIEGFENMISNIRSRGISVMLMLQSLSQLDAFYSTQSRTITDNCDTTIYMGGNNLQTAEYISRLVNKPLSKVLGMPVKTNWIIRRGEPPRFSDTVDLSEYKIPGMLRYDMRSK